MAVHRGKAFWVSIVDSDPPLDGKVFLDMDTNPDGDDLREAIKTKFAHSLRDIDASLLLVRTRTGAEVLVQTALTDLLQAIPTAASSNEASLQVFVPMIKSQGKYRFFIFWFICYKYCLRFYG